MPLYQQQLKYILAAYFLERRNILFNKFSVRPIRDVERSSPSEYLYSVFIVNNVVHC